MKQEIPYGIQDSQLQVISKHTGLTNEEIIKFIHFGFTSIFKVLLHVCELLEKQGAASTAGKLNQHTFDAYFSLIEAEFHGRTTIFFLINTFGELPIEMVNIYRKGYNTIEQLNHKINYPEEDLTIDYLNQKQLVHLFTALANANIFSSSPNLLAQSLADVTAFSENSIRKVIINTKSTNGGFKKEEKEKLKYTLNKIIDEF